jgi:pimeloyl-ACP methyl ester carboxylesterase
MGSPESSIPVHSHGGSGRGVVVIHGGPGAPGSATGLARALAGPFRVLEPWQRGSSPVPLTVERHVADLAAVLDRHAGDEEPALVGESWGAMLALAFAARHPDRVAALLLVGCGTFDPVARARLRRTLEERSTPALRARLEAVPGGADDPRRIAERYRITDPLYTYARDPDADDPDPVARFDSKAHREGWDDMLRLQAAGVYPAAFAAIRCPVLMLHGARDPHPGPLIRDSLLPFLPRLEYVELERCGHRPWVERHARGRFLALARGWLRERLDR